MILLAFFLLALVWLWYQLDWATRRTWGTYFWMGLIGGAVLGSAYSCFILDRCELPLSEWESPW